MGTFIENNPAIVFLVFSAITGIAYWAGSTHRSVRTLERFMDEIRTDIKKIFEKLPPSTVAGDSPLQLTDLGKKVSEEIQASEWAKKIASAIALEVAGRHPYEVQEFCLEYVKKENILTEDMQNRVKTSAFENGIKKEQVLRVLAIRLRDELL